MNSVWILLFLLVAIIALMAARSRGRSLDELIAESSRDHHRVSHMIARHPGGGAWRDVRRWLAEGKR